LAEYAISDKVTSIANQTPAKTLPPDRLAA
jgi:hypothetical protein